MHRIVEKRAEEVRPGDTAYFAVLSGPAGDFIFGDCAEVLEIHDDGEGVLMTIGNDRWQDHHYAPHGSVLDVAI